MTLSHIDDKKRPTMVDVSDKNLSERVAVARSEVWFPPEVFARLQSQNLSSGKGPVIDTAIIAGVMAAKRTHELIPFCHPLPLDSCKIDIENHPTEPCMLIRAKVKVTHKTGVEMEALTAVSVAALTIYDMCKALSHEIVIRHTALDVKTGGKSDYSTL